MKGNPCNARNTKITTLNRQLENGNWLKHLSVISVDLKFSICQIFETFQRRPCTDYKKVKWTLPVRKKYFSLGYKLVRQLFCQINRRNANADFRLHSLFTNS